MENLNNINESTYDVGIIGLGPTGLTLAHLLGRRGLRVIVLEKEPVFYGNARAVYTDDECLRVFQAAGVAEDLHKGMMFDIPVQFTYEDGTPIVQYTPTGTPNGWPIINFFYQPYLETTLTEKLQQYSNVTVLRGRECRSFEQDSEGVTISHIASEGTAYGQKSENHKPKEQEDEQSVRASYMVACDGGRSTVRDKLNIKLIGKSFPEPWLVVDLKQKNLELGLRHLPYFNFYCDPKGPVVSCPQPDGYHRFEFRLKKGTSKEYMEKPETIRKLLSKHVNPDHFEVKRRLVYTFNGLVAEKWKEGRIFLAGDAAHMTPQFMGQGMSSGVRDAFNLGWKLIEVMSGRASEKLLDTYQSERYFHAKDMILVSILLKDVVSLENKFFAMIRNALLRAIKSVPSLYNIFREGKFKPKPKYKKGTYLGLPRNSENIHAGTLMPQPDLQIMDGTCRKMDEIIGDSYALIGQGIDPRDGLSDASLSFLNSLGTKYITIYEKGNRPQGINEVVRNFDPNWDEVEDIYGLLSPWFRKAGYKKSGFVLLRPDKFVFGMAKGTGDKLAQELERRLDLKSAARPVKNKELVRA
ncbi:putative 3-(3-hydroxy-phenyl)propionate/3-hydroxycinnamic acid hydroxylase [Leptospira broomii serovar Hurstbridge str. 5399]|uniref:3-(3-hydroxy-phenyl)propionate/3-hydroxycinnamic acid hydroxylase n=1 Tax=Leptospira broomii serovar Hurstbridge str. 5399 TaxID=1049789 RepID=T0GPD9_9LEPT|nr:bifunctional 3-(3-hydroxy-phenyl)propionate/3-hydroxycinnamic acid hydroxylase [Leptospira broomii]EQA47193.1 putative 3-(3-hydroxy-phenyl)propionate/3-hydroxycinnamic acid hydroxylase [Leptospira broomii serovar Hurstbridge str. 5399]